MRSRITAMALCAATTLTGFSALTSAETCYKVTGSVTTENVTEALQMGTMSLTLSDVNGTVFSETGSLVGNVTDSSMYSTTLSHVARFPQGDSFVTKGDFAQITGPLNSYDEEICAFSVIEKITHIEKGTRFFKDVSSVNVIAVGSVSFCPGFNENTFELDGELCVE